jgi:hypothetical protein
MIAKIKPVNMKIFIGPSINASFSILLLQRQNTRENHKIKSCDNK